MANPDIPLPHRDPMLYVSDVWSVTEEKVRASWHPRIEHYLGRQTLREMQQVEALAQAGAIAVFAFSQESELPLFGSIERAKFGRTVEPGDVLDMEVEVLDRTKRGFSGRGVASVDGEVACEATFSGVILKEKIFRRMFENMQSGTTTPQDVEDLPGRAVNMPGVWLDKVLRSGVIGANGVWLPGAEEFEGHEFGGQAVLPGIKQVGSLEDLARQSPHAPHDLSSYSLKEVSDVVFESPVIPGQMLDLQVIGSGYKYVGEARIGGMVACKATLSF
jgi:3-hydroxyacyl-[acyl-carrier-protein] dehydratase